MEPQKATMQLLLVLESLSNKDWNILGKGIWIIICNSKLYFNFNKFWLPIPQTEDQFFFAKSYQYSMEILMNEIC